jgi:redox-sensitive bicupin YhaK (pirin superfamily)
MTKISRTTQKVVSSRLMNMGGLPVYQPLPVAGLRQIDPFLLLHHARIKFSSDRPALQQGVGPHPHCGFSPVTFLIDGEIHHRDSQGNSNIAHAGDVQWMHAGNGIQHSERPTQKIIDTGGYQELIQLWVNSPAASKKKKASYQYFAAKDMPILLSEDKKVTTKVVAGTYNEGIKGGIETESPVLILWGQATEGGAMCFEIPNDFNAGIYVTKGKLKLSDGQTIETRQLAHFDQQGIISFKCEADAMFLLISGAPIGEPVVQHGPFVVNTEEELMAAIDTYQSGKMGQVLES